METKKIKLSFVNNGEEFYMPYITVQMQEEIMEDIVELEKTIKPDTEKFLREANKIMLQRVLQKIDKSVSLENINNLHPDDYIELIKMMNQGGRELSKDEPNFQKSKKKPAT